MVLVFILKGPALITLLIISYTASAQSSSALGNAMRGAVADDAGKGAAAGALLGGVQRG